MIQVDSSYSKDYKCPTAATFFKSDLLTGEAVLDFVIVLILQKCYALVVVFPSMQKIKKCLQQKASETQHFNLYQANAAYLFLIMSTFVIKLHKGHLIKHTEDVSEICNLRFGLMTLSHFDVLNIFSKFSTTAGKWINTTLFLILLLLNVNFIQMAYNYLQIEFKAG